MTFEANTASTVTKAVSEAVNHIIKIINNCTQKKDTTVTIENVNIDVSGGYDAAMKVQGAGEPEAGEKQSPEERRQPCWRGKE